MLTEQQEYKIRISLANENAEYIRSHYLIFDTTPTYSLQVERELWDKRKDWCKVEADERNYIPPCFTEDYFDETVEDIIWDIMYTAREKFYLGWWKTKTDKNYCEAFCIESYEELKNMLDHWDGLKFIRVDLVWDILIKNHKDIITKYEKNGRFTEDF